MNTATQRTLKAALKGFEQVVVGALIVMLMLVVALTALELGWLLAKDIASPPALLLDTEELLDLFGLFLLVLIGVELLETLKAYLKNNVVHVEIVLEVALIALARKIVVLDVTRYAGGVLLGVAALVTALALALFVIRRGGARDDDDGDPRPVGA